MLDRRLLLAAVGCALAALGTAWFVVVAGGGPVGPDAGVEGWFGAEWRAGGAVVSQLGSGAVLYPALLLVAVLRRTRRSVLMPLLMAAGQVLEIVLLSVVPRAAPDLSWAGLSSGRTTTAVLGAGLIAFGLGQSWRRSLWAGAVLGSVVGGARVASATHWATDALAGLLVGFALLLTVLAVRHRLAEEPLRVRAALRALRSSRWAWALPVIAGCVAVSQLFTGGSDRRMMDFAVYVGAAGVVGQGGDLYGYRTAEGLPFTYPPFAALLAEPLSRIRLPVAQLAWTAATLAAAAAVCVVAMRPVVARLGLPVTLALLLASTPMRSHVRFGQIGVFLVLLVAWDLLDRSRRPGLGVGLAAALKLTPAIYLPWLLVTGSVKRFRFTAAYAAGATLLGVVLLWPSSPTWLGDALWDSGRFGSNDIPGNQSVRGMLLRTGLPDHLAERLWFACAVVLIIAAVLGARQLEQHGQRLAAIGVLAAGSVAASPISWQHHLVWLVLPIAALVEARRDRLAVAWACVLIAPVTTLARQLDTPVFGALLVNTCGLTAVIAIFALPLICKREKHRSHSELGEAEALARPGLGT